MSQYEHTETVRAEPQRVFEFISQVQNLPQYLPTTKSAQPQGPDRVRVQGEAAGHQYDSDGFYHVDPQKMRMEWGSDGENAYRGWMEVKDNDSGSSAEVKVHLSFEPREEIGRNMDKQTGDRDTTIRQGLEKALQSIKNLCEGTGGKVEQH
jgi:ribosome-associated toxin RatA of RatAB toxin-antitoxin module